MNNPPATRSLSDGSSLCEPGGAPSCYPVALLLDSTHNPFWITKSIQDLSKHPRYKIKLIVQNGSATHQSQRRPTFQRLRNNRFLYNRYHKLEEMRVAKYLEPYPAAELSTALSGIPIITVTPIRRGIRESFPEQDLKVIAGYGCQIIVRFGFGVLSGEILDLPEYGIWSFHHGDNDYYRGGPAGFWEVYEHAATSGVTFQLLNTSLDGGGVLMKSSLRTDLTSPLRNRLNLQLESTHTFAAFLDYFAANNFSPVSFKDRYQPSSRNYTRGIFKAPTNSQMCRFLAQQSCAALVRRVSRSHQMTETWNIGISQRDKLHMPWTAINDVAQINWARPTPGTFLADPFLATQNSVEAVFVEEYQFDRCKGRIAAATVSDSGTLSQFETVIDEAHHLSFPGIFTDPEYGQVMIPEQSTLTELRVYAPALWPFQWKEIGRIELGIHVVDPVLFRHAGQIWLFCSKFGYGGSHSQNNLYLFSADSLFGNYKPHPLNPIKLTLAGSRMGGAIHVDGETIYRFGQQCTNRYGENLVVFQVCDLTPNSYSERVVGQLSAPSTSPWSYNLHTFNCSNRFIAIDGAVRTRVNFAHKEGQ